MVRLFFLGLFIVNLLECSADSGSRDSSHFDVVGSSTDFGVSMASCMADCSPKKICQLEVGGGSTYI